GPKSAGRGHLRVACHRVTPPLSCGAITRIALFQQENRRSREREGSTNIGATPGSLHLGVPPLPKAGPWRADPVANSGRTRWLTPGYRLSCPYIHAAKRGAYDAIH